MPYYTRIFFGLQEMFHMKQKKRGGGPARKAGPGGGRRRHAAGSRKDGRSEPIQWPGVPAAPALSARKAGFGGECRRHAAGSRFFRRPRRFDQAGPPQRNAVGRSSTFHRRKVDRKAAGGPLYQRRNAPRTPRSPTQRMASAAPQPRVCRGAWLFPCGGTEGERHIPAPWLPLRENPRPPPRRAWLPLRGLSAGIAQPPLAPSDEGAVAAGD